MTSAVGVAARAVLLGSLVLALPAARLAAAAADEENTRNQLQSICEALKKTSGQACGARAREVRADPTPMTSEMSVAAPLDQPAERALVRPVDAWGRAVRISVDSGDVKLQSAGPDGEFDTADDIALRCQTTK